MKFSPAVKVGILTIVALAVLIFSLMWLKGRTLSSGERYSVEFHDVDGMKPGAMVQIMGMKVGQVEEIAPIEKNNIYQVSVRFVITDNSVFIPDGSILSVQQSGIIGEKYLEITPPPINHASVYIDKNDINKNLLPKSNVIVNYKNKNYVIGEVLNSAVKSEIAEDYVSTRSSIKVYEKLKYYLDVSYTITKAGFKIPDNIDFSIPKSMNRLEIKIPDDFIVYFPAKDVKFTAEDPLRIKEFMELQVESAKALKATNDKINTLLEPAQIAALKDTLKNTKMLTARATDVLNQANDLLVNSKEDIKKLVDLSSQLSSNMIVVTKNINDIIGDPQLQKDIKETLISIRKSTTELNEIISSSDIKDTIKITKETSENVADLVNYVKTVVKDDNLKAKFDQSLSNLDSSLDKLSSILERTDEISESQETNIKKLITDSTEISSNMKKFSKKINKHFLLLRLLF